MKLGIVADEIDRNFRRAVLRGKRLGLTRFEIRFLETGRAPVCDAGELREVEKIADGEGIKITALSPGLFKYAADEAAFRREMTEVFPRAADLARRWNLDGLIIFGFHKPGATETVFGESANAGLIDRAAVWLGEAAGKAAGSGLKLLIEPEPICRADSLENTLGLIKKSGAANVFINHDAGNLAWFAGRDESEKLKEAAHFVKNVHVKNLIFRAHQPVWTEIADGLIDYRRHFEILRGAGFNGNVSLEPHFAFDFEAFARCRDAVRKIWREAH